MQKGRRAFRLGELIVRGDKFTFTPEPVAIDAEEGEEVELVLAYAFTEASDDEEGFRVTFTTELPPLKREVSEAVLLDRPLVQDDVRGALRHVFRVPHGAFEGRFVVDATYTREPWEGGRQTKAAFRESGTFSLKGG